MPVPCRTFVCRTARGSACRSGAPLRPAVMVQATSSSDSPPAAVLRAAPGRARTPPTTCPAAGRPVQAPPDSPARLIQRKASTSGWPVRVVVAAPSAWFRALHDSPPLLLRPVRLVSTAKCAPSFRRIRHCRRCPAIGRRGWRTAEVSPSSSPARLNQIATCANSAGPPTSRAPTHSRHEVCIGAASTAASTGRATALIR